MRFKPDSVLESGSKEPAYLRMFCGQRFLQFCVIAIDIVKKTNLILLVHRCRAVDDENRNSRGKVHLKVVLIAVHRGLHPLQIPAGIVAQHPGNQVRRLLDPNASVAEIADVLLEQFRSICAVQVHVIRIGEDDFHQAQRIRVAGLLPHHQVKGFYAF